MVDPEEEPNYTLDAKQFKPLEDAYSADKIMDNKCKSVMFCNKLYTCTGGLFWKHQRWITLAELVPKESYAGATYTYSEKSATPIRGENFYEGVVVKTRGEEYVLTTDRLTIKLKPDTEEIGEQEELF